MSAAQRSVRRSLRRRRVGRAFDMAKEISAHLPGDAAVLDVGCGNGLIAHQLGGLLGRPVCGVDVHEGPEVPIDYARFDGRSLPFHAGRFDAVLLCYVLHHCVDPAGLLSDVHRVLRSDGRVVIYEDVPDTVLDGLLCVWHDHAWRSRASAGTFLQPNSLVGLLDSLGFAVVHQQQLARRRNLTHPVRRFLCVAERP